LVVYAAALQHSGAMKSGVPREPTCDEPHTTPPPAEPGVATTRVGGGDAGAGVPGDHAGLREGVPGARVCAPRLGPVLCCSWSDKPKSPTCPWCWEREPFVSS
jgi:hypothetical protein